MRGCILALPPEPGWDSGSSTAKFWGSKLVRRPHGFGPLRLGQPRSGPRCIEGYWWQCQDAPAMRIFSTSPFCSFDKLGARPPKFLEFSFYSHKAEMERMVSALWGQVWDALKQI